MALEPEGFHSFIYLLHFPSANRWLLSGSHIQCLLSMRSQNLTQIKSFVGFISYVQVHCVSLKHLKYLLILQKLLYIIEIETLSEKSNHKDEYVIKYMYGKLAQCKRCQVPSNECVSNQKVNWCSRGNLPKRDDKQYSSN